MPLLAEVAVAAALAWGSGLRLYATLFLAGLAGNLGWIELPSHLVLLQSPVVLAASGFMACVEFFADKLPWLDSLWDAVHTFIRIPAGAALAALVFGDAGEGTVLAAAIIGGSVAGGMHLAKSGTRAILNTSPEPFSNWTASATEDAVLPVGLWLAVAKPAIFFAFLALQALVALLLLAWIVKGLSLWLRRLRARGS